MPATPSRSSVSSTQWLRRQPEEEEEAADISELFVGVVGEPDRQKIPARVSHEFNDVDGDKDLDISQDPTQIQSHIATAT